MPEPGTRRPGRPAAIVLAVTAAAELAAAAVGGAYWGLTGLCAALLAVFVAEKAPADPSRSATSGRSYANQSSPPSIAALADA